ncbi:MAG: 2-aminoadipate transaminase [Luteibacter sp.]|uniref:aminotransferase-like domain-containing protein n=1 Tax=Luteibacter sp. TaxID=1886636 RepID=UPI00137C6961|nr:PLP-dependent aminotransferase family protein [Luteibacter sp.]KAF1004760.1 MAG: 2-aminoadipate transaminase [Luteibacter sp.]
MRFIERAIADGRLRPGDRLPPQRELANLLGIDLTTVTRAYTEARERNLLHARGALGSFVSAPRFDTGQVVDLGMNLPPPPLGIDLATLLRHGIDQVLTHADIHALMSYQPGGGSDADRSAGAAWLYPMLGPVDTQRIVTCPGAQAALAGIVLALTAPGDTILVEPTLYPGTLAVAARLGRTLATVASDCDGMLPEALVEMAQRTGATVVYLNPTLRNPTADTMPEQRRDAIASAIEKAGLRLIEDDPYWALAGDAPAPLARRIPAHTHYIATLSKALSPGLRTAYVAVPDGAARSAFLSHLRAVTLMATPLMTSIATQWIHDGTAKQVLEGVRAESAERQRVAHIALALEGPLQRGIHLWLDLPSHWTATALTTAARREGLAVTPSDAFRPEPSGGEAIRVSLGGVKERHRLKQGLDRLAQLLE